MSNLLPPLNLRDWAALSRVDAVFKRFKDTLREETSPDPEHRLLDFLQAAHRAGSSLIR